MTNSASEFDGAAPLANREDLDSEMPELASNLSIVGKVAPVERHQHQLLTGSDPVSLSVDTLPQSGILDRIGTATQPDEQPSNASCIHSGSATAISSTAEQLDVKAELDLLLTALQLTTPRPPQGESMSESSSIANIRAQISTTAPVTHIQESIQELNASRQQLNTAQTQLQILAQRNQIQVDRVDANVLEVKQIKWRIQQLAQHSKSQIANVGKMLDAISQIRTEIFTSLDKFGGYQEIHSLFTQLETTRDALVIAHDALREKLHERITTGQEAFYDSLQAIETQVAARSDESEAKLRHYQESIQSLSQTIATDRWRIAGMSVDMNTKIDELNALNAQVGIMHGQIVEKSQTFQSQIDRIDRGFIELSQSMQVEKEQFYALTVETIEKADLIRSQLANIITQISADRVRISTIEAEIGAIENNARQETERQSTDFARRDLELVSISNNVQIDRKNQLINIKKLSNWLWILSVGMGIISILLIQMSISLK